MWGILSRMSNQNCCLHFLICSPKMCEVADMRSYSAFQSSATTMSCPWGVLRKLTSKWASLTNLQGGFCHAEMYFRLLRQTQYFWYCRSEDETWVNKRNMHPTFNFKALHISIQLTYSIILSLHQAITLDRTSLLWSIVALLRDNLGLDGRLMILVFHNILCKRSCQVHQFKTLVWRVLWVIWSGNSLLKASSFVV